MCSAEGMPPCGVVDLQGANEQAELLLTRPVWSGEWDYSSATCLTTVAPLKLHNYRGLSGAETSVGGWLKRGSDVLIAAILLILLAPALLIITALIYLTMGRPILFSHKRVGFQGATFECYKFRTMVNNAGEKLEAYLREDPAAREEWKHYHKLKFDPRVTALGRLLRKSSLDELPQLLNVLRGDMSCVGPRPVTTAELSRYKSSARHYLQVRPGVTGLWQVSGRSNTSYDYRVALDRTYVANWSFGLDIKILVKTLPAVLRIHESA